MMTAKEARENTAKSKEVAVDCQLKDILSDIKITANAGTGIDWIVYGGITEKNRDILKEKGYEVTQYTTGACAWEWRVQW